MSLCTAHMRFYAELNVFMPPEKRQCAFSYPFSGRPSVKDAIEALGVPHTEVDLILANGASVGFTYHLRHGDRISVYPVFESLDISGLTRLRPEPLRRVAFVLDVHLGKLARILRMLGFDVRYQRDYGDHEIVHISADERRIILTRDRGLLKHGPVTHGCWIRATDPLEQARQVLRRFDLYSLAAPLTRCMRCNGIIEPVDKEAVLSRLPGRTAACFDEFYRCPDCDRIYWPGSHYDRMRETIALLLAEEDALAGEE